MILGHAFAASFRENLPCLLERLPEFPTASALIDDVKTLVTEVERSRIQEVVSASCAARAAGDDPRVRGIKTLQVKGGAKGRKWR